MNLWLSMSDSIMKHPRTLLLHPALNSLNIFIPSNLKSNRTERTSAYSRVTEMFIYSCFYKRRLFLAAVLDVKAHWESFLTTHSTNI